MQWHNIYQQISQQLGEDFSPESPSPVSGGDINQAYLLQSGSRRLFIKLNHASRLAMFEAEQQALIEMAATQTILVPQPLCCGVEGESAFIVMEYIELGGGSADSQILLGQQLAAMHRITSKAFGWSRNNTIGSTLQRNDISESWIDFWCDQRIGLQLQLLAQNGYGGRIQQLGEQLLQRLPELLAEHHPSASMLHGDLWSGNYAFNAQGQPLIFDPALYYGDRETDLAMTELFGGFSAQFYRAYQEAYPLDGGYQQRKPLYNLYHILNHGNLFGAGYISQAERMMEDILR